MRQASPGVPGARPTAASGPHHTSSAPLLHLRRPHLRAAQAAARQTQSHPRPAAPQCAAARRPARCTPPAGRCGQSHRCGRCAPGRRRRRRCCGSCRGSRRRSGIRSRRGRRTCAEAWMAMPEVMALPTACSHVHDPRCSLRSGSCTYTPSHGLQSGAVLR